MMMKVVAMKEIDSTKVSAEKYALPKVTMPNLGWRHCGTLSSHYNTLTVILTMRMGRVNE
jgi:hypothetical protein